MLPVSFSHRRWSVRSLLISCALISSACSGGGGHFVPSGTTGPQSTAPTGPTSSARNIVVSGTFTGVAPALLARTGRYRAAHRQRNALTFNHIQVNGTLFPGDAGPYEITNSINISVPSGSTYSASVPFSNVPVHNNEWAILDFVGVASDGSQVYLGELGGLINVGSSPTNTASVTASTTLTLQVFLALIQTGALSTYDLNNTSTLASTLTSDIAATHAATDSSTGLFDAPALTTVYDAIAPKFERDLEIGTSPSTPGSFTIVQDYASGPELNLVNNTSLFSLASEYALEVQTPKVGEVIGASGCGGITSAPPTHDPAAFPLAPTSVTACTVQSANGTITIRGVYGGDLVVGATNYSYTGSGLPPTSYVGGVVGTSGEPVGLSKATVDVKSSELTYSVSDPAGVAFGTTLEDYGTGLLNEQIAVPSGLYSSTAFEIFSQNTDTPVTTQTPYTAANDKVVVDTFTPFNLSTADLELCGGISCYPLTTSTSTKLAISRPFEDPGTLLSYFNWKTAGALKSITEPYGVGNGYQLDFTTAGTGTLSTTTPTVFTPRETLQWSSDLPAGTQWTLQVKDAADNTYANGTLFDSSGAQLTMASIYQTVPTSSVTMTITVPAAGEYSFGGLVDTCNDYQGGACI